MKVWKLKLRTNYTDFEEFESYSEIYGLAERLGFSSAQEAWEANPMIQGSTDPKDFKVVLSPYQKRKVKKMTDWIFDDDDRELIYVVTGVEFRSIDEDKMFNEEERKNLFINSARKIWDDYSYETKCSVYQNVH